MESTDYGNGDVDQLTQSGFTVVDGDELNADVSSEALPSHLPERLESALLFLHSYKSLALALLQDAIAVFQGTTSLRDAQYEQERTTTYAWFFFPGRYGEDDPFSFATICDALGFSATAIRDRLRRGVPIDLRGLGIRHRPQPRS